MRAQRGSGCPPQCSQRTQFGEELAEGAHEVAQGEPPVGHDALDLVELGQVRGVQALVAEHAVDGEIFHGGELLLREGEGQVRPPKLF